MTRRGGLPGDDFLAVPLFLKNKFSMNWIKIREEIAKKYALGDDAEMREKALRVFQRIFDHVSKIRAKKRINRFLGQ